MHHPVGEVNVHVKRAVIAGFCLRLLAFEFSKSANFKLVVSDCLDPFDGAGTACFLDELYPCAFHRFCVYLSTTYSKSKETRV